MAKKANDSVVSIQLHGVRASSESSLDTLDTLLKTFNSASRCAFKRFSETGLKGMWKRGGKQGFWQKDKDLGSPIQGAVESTRMWLERNHLELDSIMMHNAVMAGFRNYMSFERQKSKWRTSKDSPSFGDMDARSRNKLTKDEFQLTRNGSFTVIGKAKTGNPKFKFNVENHTAYFTYRRKRIQFSFTGNRFSRKGWSKFCEIASLMDDGKLPVTVTLSKTGHGKFNITLTYSQDEFRKVRGENPMRRSSIVSGIWVNDEVVHHQILDTRNNRLLHSRTYKVEDFSGEKKIRKYIETCKWNGDWRTVRKLKERSSHRLVSGTRTVLSKILNICRCYGAKTMVMEKPSTKGRRSFNCSLITSSMISLKNGSGKGCFMPYSSFVKLVRGQCAKCGMELSMVNGEFIQLKAILDSNPMSDAIRNACTDMVKRQKGYDPRLTDWRKYVSDPSMLDWIGHLLHNKRPRQARGEIKIAFQTRAVEKAVRLVDNRHIRSTSVQS